MDRKLYKKTAKSGLHSVTLSPGSQLNGNDVYGRVYIGPGDTVFCFPNELGKHASDLFTTSTPTEPDEAEIIAEGDDVVVGDEALPPVSGPVIRKRKARGDYYDVVNPDNPEKPYNPKPLKLDKAMVLYSQLTGGADPVFDPAINLG